MQLTANFTLEEMLHSNAADVMGFQEQYQPSDEVVDNLRLLAETILQPLRDEFKKPISVNCGYRCKRVNDAVKGVTNSQHMKGQATDITSKDNKLLFDTIKEMDLPFDQLINEKNYSWIHVSYNKDGNRRQILHL